MKCLAALAAAKVVFAARKAPRRAALRGTLEFGRAQIREQQLNREVAGAMTKERGRLRDPPWGDGRFARRTFAM